LYPQPKVQSRLWLALLEKSEARFPSINPAYSDTDKELSGCTSPKDWSVQQRSPPTQITLKQSQRLSVCLED